MRIIRAAILFALGTVCLFAQKRQTTQNPLSPAAATGIKLGGHSLDIEYNSPSARGRKVEGGLIPYAEGYRLGADSATTITTAADIKIGSLIVPKGVHTLFLAASPTTWQLIINNQTGQWGLDYDKKRDLGRVPMTLKKLPAPVEQMKLELRVTSPKTGLLSLTWGTTNAEVPVSVE